MNPLRGIRYTVVSFLVYFVLKHPVYLLIHPSDELTPDDEPEFLYYLNDGVYGSFSSKLLGSTIPAPAVHKVSSSRPGPHQRRRGQ